MASTINASNSGFGGIVSTGDSSGQLQLQTAGTTAVTIDTSQNVGIGITAPGAKLDVGGTIYSRPGNSTGAVAVLTADATSGANGISLSSSFVTGGYGPIIFNTTATERMRIDSSGNVLVGTTTARGNFTIPSSGQIKPAGFTVVSGGANYLGPVVTGQLAFASWNNGSGYALVAFQGTNTTLISSSNSAGGNNAFDITNNQSSNSGNGVAMFVSSVNIYFQTKVNFTAAGSVYIMYLGG